MSAQGMRVADARDFKGQAVTLEDVGDADAVVFPEIGVALVGGDAAQARGMSVHAEIAADSPIEAIEPEYFVFAEKLPPSTCAALLRAAETIARVPGRHPDDGCTRTGRGRGSRLVLGATRGG